jgi:hypothetical protein
MINVRNVLLMGVTGLLLVACADDNNRMESSSGYQSDTSRNSSYDNSAEPIVRQSQSK